MPTTQGSEKIWQKILPYSDRFFKSYAMIIYGQPGEVAEGLKAADC
ncbi:hypothetical protein [Planktothricoides sp. SR001]|nr:hypothetical protein [Planktothricoides sp. SR001]